MEASPSAFTGGDTRRQARRGLAVYFAIVVLFSAVFEGIMISQGSLSPWIVLPLMWVPAMASVVARLVLREGFSDVSFRLGGRRGWKYILLAVIFPIVFGLVVYGIAWTTGLAGFDPQPEGLAGSLAGDASSPATFFLIELALAATVGTILGFLTASGEEIGWRGYMLTRLIDAGVPRPVLVSGLIWSLWHVPLALAGVYMTGPSPALSAVLLIVAGTSYSYVFARLRLESGSVWPAITLHAAGNSIIQSVFDTATTGLGRLCGLASRGSSSHSLISWRPSSSRAGNGRSAKYQKRDEA